MAHGSRKLYMQIFVVLFVLTIILNGMARLLILATRRKGTAHP